MGVVWITGLSGAGKTTLAREIILQDSTRSWIHLDGDSLRQILVAEKDSLYDIQSRHRLGLAYSALASYISNQGFDVVVSTISMFQDVFRQNREINAHYYEVFIDVKLDKLVQRNSKSVYQKDSTNDIVGIGIAADFPSSPNYIINQEYQDTSCSRHASAILANLPWRER